jgi:hypothetical protein
MASGWRRHPRRGGAPLLPPARGCMIVPSRIAKAPDVVYGGVACDKHQPAPAPDGGDDACFRSVPHSLRRFQHRVTIGHRCARLDADGGRGIGNVPRRNHDRDRPGDHPPERHGDHRQWVNTASSRRDGLGMRVPGRVRQRSHRADRQHQSVLHRAVQRQIPGRLHERVGGGCEARSFSQALGGGKDNEGLVATKGSTIVAIIATDAPASLTQIEALANQLL